MERFTSKKSSKEKTSVLAKSSEITLARNYSVGIEVSRSYKCHQPVEIGKKSKNIKWKVSIMHQTSQQNEHHKCQDIGLKD